MPRPIASEAPPFIPQLKLGGIPGGIVKALHRPADLRSWRPIYLSGEFYSVCKSRSLCVLFITRVMGGDVVYQRENRYFPAFDNKHLEFFQKMPIIILHLPPARLAFVARVGLYQQRSPVWRHSLTGLFVSGVRHAA